MIRCAGLCCRQKVFRAQIFQGPPEIRMPKNAPPQKKEDAPTNVRAKPILGQICMKSIILSDFINWPIWSTGDLGPQILKTQRRHYLSTTVKNAQHCTIEFIGKETFCVISGGVQEFKMAHMAHT